MEKSKHAKNNASTITPDFWIMNEATKIGDKAFNSLASRVQRSKFTIQTMERSKHTKGPWGLSQWPDERVKDNCKFVITDSRGVGIATLNQKGVDPITESNAKLLASAPELLKALEAILATTGWHRIGDAELKEALELVNRFK